MKEKYTEFQDRLLSILGEPDLIQRVVDLYYDFWGSPLAIYDLSFKRIASSSQYVPEDDLALNALSDGYMVPATINMLKRQGRFDIYNSDKLYQITDVRDIDQRYRIKGQDFGYVDVPIRAEGTIIGLMAMMAMKEVPAEADAECLLAVSRIISLVLQKDSVYMRSVRNKFDILFRDLLQGTLSDPDVIASRLQSLGKKPGKYNKILVSEFQGLSEEEGNRRSLMFQSSVRDLLPGTASAYFGGNIVFLISSDKESDLTINNRFSEFTKISKVHVGVSRQFHDFSQIPEHFEQAKAALRLGSEFSRHNHIFTYDRYYLVHEVQLLSDITDLQRYCLPAMLDLATSKKKTDHDFLVTLYYYLAYSRDWEKVCEKLHIHKSTLFYRIKKVREILEMDFDNGQHIYAIMHSYLILTYTGLLTI